MVAIWAAPVAGHGFFRRREMPPSPCRDASQPPGWPARRSRSVHAARAAGRAAMPSCRPGGDIAAQTEHDVGLRAHQVPAAFQKENSRLRAAEFLQQALRAPARARIHACGTRAAAPSAPPCPPRRHPDHFPAAARICSATASPGKCGRGAACHDERVRPHACSPAPAGEFPSRCAAGSRAATKFREQTRAAVAHQRQRQALVGSKPM